MTVTIETPTIYDILVLARQLSIADRHWLADLLRRESDAPLPVRATLDEAVALFLADACSLGRAAELAGVTRWDIQDRLRELGISIPIPGDQTAQEMDELEERLEQAGML